MDLIIRNVRLPDRPETTIDIGIEAGRIIALEHSLSASAKSHNAQGRLACAGLVENAYPSRQVAHHRPLHSAGAFKLSPVIGVALLKKDMSVEDVHARAAQTLEQCILHGTTRMRTQVEVDPGIGMRGFDGV